jgi:hypothetical protein
VIVRTARWQAAAGRSPGPGPGIGRRAAQQLARRELSRSIYRESILTRFWHWVGHELSDLLNAGGSLPGGWWTTVVLVTVLVLVDPPGRPAPVVRGCTAGRPGAQRPRSS